MTDILGIAKLDKMLFRFYTDPAMQGNGIATFEAMYNPSSFSLTYGNQYDPGEDNSTGTAGKKHNTRKGRSLSVTLIFDGTGASPSNRDSVAQTIGSELLGGAALKRVNVHETIERFLSLAYKINGKIHVPNFVKVTWGPFLMTCVLASSTVTYKLFKPNGHPLRAELKVELDEHIEDKILNEEIKKSSPDLTHAYRVKEGDRLDAICHSIYGSSHLYLEVAKTNNLKNNRKLVAGTTLFLPPIDKRD
jgi:phage tail protein X